MIAGTRREIAERAAWRAKGLAEAAEQGCKPYEDSEEETKEDE